MASSNLCRQCSFERNHADLHCWLTAQLRHFSKVTSSSAQPGSLPPERHAHPRPGTPDETVVAALIATNVLQPNAIVDWTGAYV